MSTDPFGHLTLDELAALIADLAVPKPNRNRRSERARIRGGVRMVLGPVADQPGATWQHRWYAANGDQMLLAYAATRPTAIYTKNQRGQFNSAIHALVAHGVIRPGITAMTPMTTGTIIRRAVETQHADDFRRVIEEAGRIKRLEVQAEREIRNALAAMILFTGKSLAQITPTEWAMADHERLGVVTRYSSRSEIAQQNQATLPEGHRLITTVLFASAYAAAVNAGLICHEPNPEPGKPAIPATLRTARREPFSIDYAIRKYGQRLGPNVAAIVRDTLTIKGHAYDNTYIKALISRFSMLIDGIRHVSPEHGDTLNIPVHVADQALRYLEDADAPKRRPGTKRRDLGATLGASRTMWDLCTSVVHQHDALAHHRPLLGEFPIDPDVVRQKTKNDKHRREAALQEEVRRQVLHLDRIVESAARWSEDAAALAAHAATVAPGDTFTHNQTLYERAPLNKNGAAQGQGRATISIRHANTKRAYYDADEAAMKSARAHLLVMLLRELGVRLEEAHELTLSDIQPMSNGETSVPIIDVNPSKLDKSRAVPCSQELLETIHTYVQRVTTLYGHYPKSIRFDEHEEQQQEPDRFLLFQYRQHQFTGIAPPTLRTWLNDIAERYDKEDNTTGIPVGRLRPHGVRRAVATDLNDRGAPLTAIQHLLGHSSLHTTNIYIKPDQLQAIADIAQALRKRHED